MIYLQVIVLVPSTWSDKVSQRLFDPLSDWRLRRLGSHFNSSSTTLFNLKPDGLLRHRLNERHNNASDLSQGATIGWSECNRSVRRYR